MEERQSSLYSCPEEDWDIYSLQYVNSQLETYLKMLPAGVDLTLSELQDMAARQQQQIEGQQQTLVAKEQRLKFLKQQEMKHQHISNENERLRKLREKVESQELKLKKLRAVRGQVEQHRQSNGHLNAELESIRSLFNEKEKELAMAVSKVDELTRQLEEIRKGKLNGFNGDMSNSAAAIELEKLKKELLARNKLNDEENSRLIAQRRVLRERKDTVANMNNRIQELQQRLKKKKLQQADAQNKLMNQKVINFNKENDKLANRSNVAAVEPYIQKPPQRPQEQENLKNKIDDYKHQNVQNSVKISDKEKDMYNEKHEGKGMSDGSVSTSERSEDFKVPLVVSVDATNKNKHEPQPRQSNKEDIKPPPPCTPHSSSAPVKFPSYPNSRQAMGNIANFVPRPFGSTYGTSHLGRNLNSAPSVQQPNINIHEERQAGSGQSSPASSESSHCSLTQKMSPREVVGGNFPSNGEDSGKFNDHSAISSNNNWNNQISAPPVPTRVPYSSGPSVPPSNQNPTTIKNNVAPGSIAFSHPVSKPSPQNSISVSQGGTVTPVSQSNQNNFTNSHTRPPDTYPSVPPFNQQYSNQSSDSNKSVETQESQQGMGEQNQINSNGTKSSSNTKPRYAPKSVIENTYMKRLGNDTLQKYQKNIGLLYKSLSSKDGASKPSELPSESNVPNQTVHSPDSQLPVSNGTNNPPSSPRHGHPHHFPQSASPNHPDIASDKGSYKVNTPKYIRRRHSDSENDDLTRILKPQEKYDYPPPYHSVTNSANTITDPTLFESQVTSFSTPTPEKVSLDNLGNIVDLEPRDSSDQGSTSSSSQEDLKPSSVIIETISSDVVVRRKKTNLKKDNSRRSSNRVSFDPLALLLDASLEGELELVRRTASEVPNVSASNDEGITALHNAICAGHLDIVKFLVVFGCDVNSPDSDGWTPLHCAASCNNLQMVKFLVEHGACIFATTISDHETAAEKCEEDEDGYDGCFEYLYSIQQKLGILNNGIVYGVFDYKAMNPDELSFKINDKVMILRKGDENEKEWWWSKIDDQEGYVPRNMFGLSPRVLQEKQEEDS